VTTLAQLLAERRHVLLDFDGPVCSVFGSVKDRQVANALREVVASYAEQIPESVASANDPFEVLRFAAHICTECLLQTEVAFTAYEVEAVATAPETPGIRAALAAFESYGLPVTIVSNNSAAAIASFIEHRRLASNIAGVVGRVPAQPALLKPSPYLLGEALKECGATSGDALFIGDSISDIEAATAIGVPVVAYANKPGKRERFEAMHAAVVIDSMWNLSSA
jgi:phosphoglycolate phosphatase-like HAD superfamily hydrolase